MYNNFSLLISLTYIDFMLDRTRKINYIKPSNTFHTYITAYISFVKKDAKKG